MINFINRKALFFIVIAALCACLLLVLGKKTETEVKGEDVISDYIAETEGKLTELISALTGSNEVKVMVTIECGPERIYATNSEITDSVQRNEYYSAGEEEALLIKEILPRIKGVAVVCDGGDNTKLRTKIIQLVSGVLDISSNHIFVG